MKLQLRESKLPKRQRAAEVIGAATEEREFDPRSLITEEDKLRYAYEIQRLECSERTRASYYYATLFPEQASDLQLEELWAKIQPMLNLVQGETRAWCIALFPGRCELSQAERTPPKKELLAPPTLPQQKIKLKREELHIQQFAATLAVYEQPNQDTQALWRIALDYLQTIRRNGRGAPYVKAFAWLRLVDPDKVEEFRPTAEEYRQALQQLHQNLDHERSWTAPPEQWFPQSLETTWSLWVLSADVRKQEGRLGEATHKKIPASKKAPLPDRLTA